MYQSALLMCVLMVDFGAFAMDRITAEQRDAIKKD